MGINKFYLATVLIFCNIFTSIRCTKNTCLQSNYSFKIGVKATPDIDSININDTIWLEIDEPTTLLNIENGAFVNYSNATYLGSNLGFQQILSATQFRSAADDFGFVLLKGLETSNANSSLYRDYRFAEENNRYRLKLGIIPKRLGVYRLLFGSVANVSRNNSNCERASFQIDFKDTDQHYYLFPGHSGNPPLSSGLYYFKVK